MLKRAHSASRMVGEDGGIPRFTGALPCTVRHCRCRPAWFGGLLVLAAAAALSCSPQREGQEWIRKRPPEAFYVKWEELPPEHAREVPPERREEAVALLQAESGRLLSQDEIHRFVPRASGLGRRWYLLRAVRSPENGGTFHVLTRGRQVAVTYRTPSTTNETVKSAVAAYLELSPEALYVEVSTGQ